MVGAGVNHFVKGLAVRLHGRLNRRFRAGNARIQFPVNRQHRRLNVWHFTGRRGRPIKGNSRFQFGHLCCHPPGHHTPKTEPHHAHPLRLGKRLCLQKLPAALEIFHKLIGSYSPQRPRHILSSYGLTAALP